MTYSYRFGEILHSIEKAFKASGLVRCTVVVTGLCIHDDFGCGCKDKISNGLLN